MELRLPPHETGLSVSILPLQRTVFSSTLILANGVSRVFLLSFTLVVRDALFRDACGDFLRLCERLNPLVIIIVLQWVFFLLQEHQLRVEWEPTLPETTAPLSSTRKGNDGIQVFVTPVRPGALMGVNLTRGSEAVPAPSFPHSAASYHELPCIFLPPKLYALLERIPRQRDVFRSQSSVGSRL